MYAAMGGHEPGREHARVARSDVGDGRLPSIEGLTSGPDRSHAGVIAGARHLPGIGPAAL
jgi:hypothetical protein